jgi:hypothetical protein
MVKTDLFYIAVSKDIFMILNEDSVLGAWRY